ncbi:response regulator transcription factor [Nonomuraea sp. H19]|jgi:DNA-binding CsgD family transcriptional regulator|uniref:response regulator transcription factor n=1 Tax=Nonomuraea sp. H19 TaxID=3452206 RepID=UPI003F8AFD88
MASSISLSDRDLNLLTLLAAGFSTERIAQSLYVSKPTAAEHCGRLFARFGCKNRTELVAYAYAHGLLETGVWPPHAARQAHQKSWAETLP